MVEPLWTINDVAHHLGVDAKTILRLEGDDPDFPRSFLVTARERRWRPQEFERWDLLQECKARLAGPPKRARRGRKPRPGTENDANSGTGRDRQGQAGTTDAPGDLGTRRRPDPA
jgi:predicted DNA-binding transcriptional regulator AlpA